jgi:murein DD-endopeptidase MepM/ murein hydrolase activator NlpD
VVPASGRPGRLLHARRPLDQESVPPLPLEYSRISSGFSEARFHPILQRWRAHKGIDYAAASGTGVKATADGFVDTRVTTAGYGNVVVFATSRNTPPFTAISRVSRAGISRGARISQGQIIGYVGMTGLATGPHLHYEFRINDVHMDPLRVAMPDAPPITPDKRVSFDAISKPMASASACCAPRTSRDSTNVRKASGVRRKA